MGITLYWVFIIKKLIQLYWEEVWLSLAYVFIKNHRLDFNLHINTWLELYRTISDIGKEDFQVDINNSH